MLCVAAAFAAATITLSSCGGNPADKTVRLLNEATEQVKKAKSYDELKNIEKTLEDKLEKLEEGNKDFEPTEKQEEAMREAMKSFQKAWREANRELR